MENYRSFPSHEVSTTEQQAAVPGKSQEGNNENVAEHVASVVHEVETIDGQNYDTFKIQVNEERSGRSNAFIVARALFNDDPALEVSYGLSAYITVQARRVKGTTYYTSPDRLREGQEYEDYEGVQPSDYLGIFDSPEDAEAFATEDPDLRALVQAIGGYPRGEYLGQGVFGLSIVRP